MLDRGNRYLIVGAGVSGLAAARHLAHFALPFDVVDRNPGAGGLWDRHVPGNGMYHSAHFISSKTRTAFPDCPMPEIYPDFPSNEQVLAYLRDFARHFNLYQYIEFEREVTWMEPAAGDNGWLVRLNGGEERRYKGVILATGHFWDPVLPQFPGHFDGHCLHAVQYKSREMFAGKQVVIVGLGNSACDIACDAVQAGAASVTVSARSGAWIVPKYVLGRPADATGGRLTGRLPRPLRNWLNGLALRLLAPNPERFGLPAPRHAFHERIPVVNTLFLYYIGHGRLFTRPGIKALHGRRILFDDDSPLAGRYSALRHRLPRLFPVFRSLPSAPNENLPDFYLHAFHPQRDDLFMVGIDEQSSGGWSIHDAQARTIARYLYHHQANPAAARRARAALPLHHRRVRQVSRRLFSSDSRHAAIQIEENIV